MIDFKYRPDVDGFRAVAVVLVLLFHAGLGFTGGYIGVDVFFVVSGYLITGLILKEQQTQTFQLRNFWVRRIRRIIPASTVVVLAVLIAAMFILLPRDYMDLAESTISQQLMLSNVYFWRFQGYFTGTAELKPLLHTWSLAVEEQFYLGFPFLLVFLHRFARKWMGTVLAGIFALSFFISVLGVELQPGAAFYLLPFRAWELLLGGLIWFVPAPTRLKDWQLSAMSWLSLIGVLVVGWFYTDLTPFPGFAAMAPCAATALLIYANSSKLLGAGRLLATKPIVFVGLISYSLYLWHWPILAFLRYRLGEELEVWVAVSALVASFGLAYLSWRFVETPFRTRSIFKDKKKLVAAACTSTVVLIVASILLIQFDGLMIRYDKKARQILTTMEEKEFRHIVPIDDVKGDELPVFGNRDTTPEILVWGDSHAMALMPAISRAAQAHGLGGVQATYGGTLPLLDFPNTRSWAAPKGYAESVIDLVVRNDIKFVILAGYWERDTEDDLFAPSLRKTVDRLLSEGCSVIIVKDVPDQRIDPRMEITKGLQNNLDLSLLGIHLDVHRIQQAEANKVLMGMEGPGVRVVDPAPYLADADGICHIIFNGDCMYWDNHHITVSGAMRLIPLFENALRELGSKELEDSPAP